MSRELKEQARSAATVLIVMGVSGAGKTTVGIELARRLGWAFEDADTHHLPGNIAKMQAGVPLTDLDRKLWLDALAALIERAISSRTPLVLACSALKRQYRAALAQGHPEVGFLYLRIEPDLVEQRLRRRLAHFMPHTLLSSQLQALESPDGEENVVTLDARMSVEAVVSDALGKLAGRSGPAR
jgi:carbohydrate kinase (thermoresistant glucokinase family)